MILDTLRALFGRDDASSPAGPASRSAAPGDPRPTVDPVHLAACALLLEVAYADGEFSEPERAHLEQVLERHFELPPASGRQVMELAEEERRSAVDQYRFTSTLMEHYDIGQKMVLAEIMWGLVLADGEIAEHEHYMTRKISNLLGLAPGYLSAAKAAAASGKPE